MRAHGFGERLVLGTDIYEIFSPRGALAAGCERLFKTAVDRVAGTVNFTAECACFSSQLKIQRSSKAGSDVHTSTNFFVMWKSFGWNFCE